MPRRKAAPRVNMHMSTAWPPGEFSVHATLVQPACVKCRRSQFQVRRIRNNCKHLWQEDCASVCDKCWDNVLQYMGEHLASTASAFWNAEPSKPPKTVELVNLLDFAPHKHTAQIWERFKASRRTKRIKRPSG